MRGKQAAASAARRAREASETELATYQRRVADLTAELAKSKTDHAEQIKSLQGDIRTLRAQRDEGTSPRVAALESELRRLRDRVTAAESVQRERQKAWDRMWVKIGDSLMEFGIVRTQFEAYQLVVGRTVEVAGGQVDRWEKLGLNREQQEALSRASHKGKGHRTYDQILEDWNRRVAS